MLTHPREQDRVAEGPEKCRDSTSIRFILGIIVLSKQKVRSDSRFSARRSCATWLNCRLSVEVIFSCAGKVVDGLKFSRPNLRQQNFDHFRRIARFPAKRITSELSRIEPRMCSSRGGWPREIRKLILKFETEPMVIGRDCSDRIHEQYIEFEWSENAI